MPTLRHTLLAIVALILTAGAADAQWENRYPKVAGMGHHVYLEGYDLPTMNVGPTGPAVSPDGTRIAFSARGWIWVLDLATGRARRVTDGPDMDFRPAWSPDGSQLAFVRDNTLDTWIVTRTLSGGNEERINTPALELDPTFGPDGTLYYSSAAEGTIDLWKRAPNAVPERITTKRGNEFTPTVSRDGRLLLYMHKLGGDRVTLRNLSSGDERELITERIVSQSRPAISPDGTTAVYGWATDERYELRLVSVSDPSTTVRLTTGARGLPLSPAWSPTGEELYFTEAGADEVMRLYRIARTGGEAQEVRVLAWDWGQPTGTVRITTREGAAAPVPARLTVSDGAGHPAVPGNGYAQFALQHGRIFFYSPGVIDITVPAGRVTVGAVRGLTTAEVSQTVAVAAGEVVEVSLALQHVWDSRASGYLSADHHFHLNYGGAYTLEPDDLVTFMRGENLNLATPVVGNLHNRFEEQQQWGFARTSDLPLIQFAQEVRSHFLGHVSLLNTKALFWPWIWGPGYQVYGADDRANSEPLAFARSQGGFGGYVHPVAARDPFSEEGRKDVPVMLAVDGILGNLDWLEVACLWTDGLGTSALWYEFLNLGNAVALEAGTDVMNNYYRTMAVGTTRLYVDTKGAANFTDYYANMRAGRSFVTTGPMLLFTAGGKAPGDALPTGGATSWELTMHSAVPVDSVDIVVNGEVVWSAAGVSALGTKKYTGSVVLPAGGWIAARARGGEPVWPSMSAYAFAHTSPVWISQVGSTDRAAMQRAASRLGPVLDVAQQQVVIAYGNGNAPNILSQFAAARARLTSAMR